MRATRRKKRRPITPEDLLKFHLVADPQISPDGRWIVFGKKHIGTKNDYVTNLWMVGTDGGAPRQFTSGGKDGHGRFSPDGSRLAFISGREKTRPQIYTLAATGGEATPLTKFPDGAIASFKWSPNGRLLAVSFREQDHQWTEQAKKDRETKGLSTPPRVLDDWWYRLDGDGYFNAQRHLLYIVDAATGEHRVLYTKDTLGHFEYDFSPDSRQLVLATNRDRKAMTQPWKQELVRVQVADGRVTPIPGVPDGAKAAVCWSPDGRLIAWAGRAGEEGTYGTENLELWVCDPVRGKARSLTGKTDFCLMAIAISDTAEVAFSPSVRFSPDGRRIFMKVGWRGQAHIASIVARGGRIKFHTKGPATYDMGNMSRNGSRMALSVSVADRLAEIAVGQVTAGTMRTKLLTDFNGPLLSELKLAQPQEAWVKAEDGWKTQLWMLKPPDFKRGRKYPAVLEIHGGPHAMYGLGFFHEFQVLAAAGYVVVFSNPRGSKGYGRDHCAAIKGSWGKADWADVQAVTRYMQSRPFVNRRRMGVMGGSYGGYMTNWVIGHSRDFAGAVTDRCVSNLVSQFGTSDFTEAPDRYWPGNSWDRAEQMWEMSPMKHMGRARTPTLIIHSEGDLRCNVEQAEQVFTALKLRNVPTRFVRYPSSTFHGLSRNGPPDLRLHRLHQILAWWKRWL